MNASSNVSLPSRVAPNQSHAFGGIWRLTFRRFLFPGHWLMVAFALAVLTLVAFASAHGRGDDSSRYLNWLIRFYVTGLVPALAFMSAGGAMRDELKSGTVDYVLTRPVRRPAFIVFKYVAHMICTQVDFIFALAVVLAVGVTRDVPGLAALAPKLLFGQVLMVAAFSAFGFLGGVLTSRYVIIGLAYGAVIEAGVGQIPTQLSRLSMTHQMGDLLRSFMESVPLADGPVAWITTGLVLAFTALMLAAAAGIFTVRELSTPADA